MSNAGSGWVIPTTTSINPQVLIDGSIQTTVHCLTSVFSFYMIKNLQLYRGGYGINNSGSHSMFINCYANLNGLTGFVTGGNNCLWLCRAYQAGFYGYQSTGGNSVFRFCEGYLCTQYGFNISSYDVLDNCIAYKNTTSGINIANNGARIFNCVIDGNTQNGVLITTAAAPLAVIERCRITNNGTGGTFYGINSTSAFNMTYEDYNVFYNDGSTGIKYLNQVQISGGHSINTTSATDVGYTNRSSTPPNYNILPPAILQPGTANEQNANVKVSLPDGPDGTNYPPAVSTNFTYITAGIQPTGISPGGTCTWAS